MATLQQLRKLEKRLCKLQLKRGKARTALEKALAEVDKVQTELYSLIRDLQTEIKRSEMHEES